MSPRCPSLDLSLLAAVSTTTHGRLPPFRGLSGDRDLRRKLCEEVPIQEAEKTKKDNLLWLPYIIFYIGDNCKSDTDATRSSLVLGFGTWSDFLL